MDYINSDAEASNDGAFRWTLQRIFGNGPLIPVLMTNPSLANADRDDPTVLQVRKLAAANGYGGFVVLNRRPTVSARPCDIAAIEMRLGKERVAAAYARNEAAIAATTGEIGEILLAYGCDPAAHQLARTLFGSGPVRLKCLGRTKDGFPLHPLARGKLRIESTRHFEPFTFG